MFVHLSLLHHHVWIGAKTASSGSAGRLRLFARRRLRTRSGHLRSVCGMCRVIMSCWGRYSICCPV
jgi:hypothetical protein